MDYDLSKVAHMSTHPTECLGSRLNSMMSFRTFACVMLTVVSVGMSAADVRAAPDQDLERRARNGSVDAMVEVGEQYLRQGDRLSLIEAYAWLHLAD